VAAAAIFFGLLVERVFSTLFSLSSLSLSMEEKGLFLAVKATILIKFDLFARHTPFTVMPAGMTGL
jgi:hypothetical protein